jgi:hypothetical protein
MLQIFPTEDSLHETEGLESTHPHAQSDLSAPPLYEVVTMRGTEEVPVDSVAPSNFVLIGNFTGNSVGIRMPLEF